MYGIHSYVTVRCRRTIWITNLCFILGFEEVFSRIREDMSCLLKWTAFLWIVHIIPCTVGMALNERIGMCLTQEAAGGRTDHNNGWNGVKSNTWKPCDWGVRYHSITNKHVLLSHTPDRSGEMCCFTGSVIVIRRPWSKLGISALLKGTSAYFSPCRHGYVN